MTDQRTEDIAIPGYSRSPGSRVEKAAMAAALVIGIVGLTWLGFKVNGPDRTSAIERHAGENNLIYSEITTLFVPQAFLELAHEPSTLADLESDAAIQVSLQVRGLEKAWYAITARGFQANGQEVRMTAYSRPFQISSKRLEFRAVLETLAGSPPRNDLVDYSTAEVRVIPANLASAEPREAIDELMAISTQSEAGLPQSD